MDTLMNASTRSRAALAAAAAGMLTACGAGAITAASKPGQGGGSSPTVKLAVDVVVASDLRFNQTKEAFAVVLDGSSQISLSATQLGGGTVKRIGISPDRNRLAFVAARVFTNIDELWVVDLRTTTPAFKVHPDLADGQRVRDFVWAPDSSRIAYVADAVTTGVPQLFTVRENGTDLVQVSPDAAGPVAFPLSRDFAATRAAFEWNPDSSHLACATRDPATGHFHLYVVAPDGSNALRIAPALASAPGLPMDREFERPYLPFGWAPAGDLAGHLAFLVAQASGAAAGSELRIVAADGSDDRRLSARFDPANLDPDDLRFAWAPDGSRLVYATDGIKADLVELWSIDPRSTDPDVDATPISKRPLDRDGGVIYLEPDAFEWAPDSSRVAFRGDLDRRGIVELYVADPLARSRSNERVNTELPLLGQNVERFRWAPDSSRLAYIANEISLQTYDLLCARADGSNLFLISRNDLHADVLFASDAENPAYTAIDPAIQWSPDSLRLAWVADQNVDGVFEAFAALCDGSLLQRVSGSLAPSGGDVCRLCWHDAELLLYAADERELGRFELYSARPDGPTGTVLTGASRRGGTSCPDFEIR